MYKIGKFSKLCNTTIKTLRFYDSAGILKPDYIDSSTGYRYYYKNKVITYQKIMSLKGIGFTLEEIRCRFMNTANEEIIALLNKKESELLAAYQNCCKLKHQYEGVISMCKENCNIKVRINYDLENQKIVLNDGNQIIDLFIKDKDASSCIQMLHELLNGDLIVNIDFVDLCYIINKNQKGLFNALHIKDAKIVNYSILNLFNMRNSIVLIKLSENKSLEEINPILNSILAKFPKNAIFIWGAAIDKSLDNEFVISMINFS